MNINKIDEKSMKRDVHLEIISSDYIDQTSKIKATKLK
jgi:hypothetical protein